MHPLVRRQLRKAFPDGVPATPEVAALAEAVGEAYRAADDDRAQLERSLELASQELVARNQAMTLILDTVAQGLVTVGLDGALGTPCSRALTAWFGAPSADARLWSYLCGHDPNLEAWIELGFDSLREERMPAEVVLAQLPGLIERAARTFRVEYLPIGAPLTGLLVVVTDTTDAVALERAERAQAEVIAAVERAAQDRAGFLAFAREADARLAACADPAVDPVARARHVHTLKATFGLFGLTSLGGQCHQLESQLADGSLGATPAAVAPIAAAWQAFRDRLDGLLGLSGRRTLVVDWAEYQAVVAAVADADAPWATRVRRWGLEPTRPHLERFGEQAKALASRLGKAEVEVDVRDHGVRLDGDRFAPLWSALVHTITNAVAHGVEDEATRVATGKSAQASLRLASFERDAAVVVEVADDGAGVDWVAVAARAQAQGLPCTTADDLRAALCADGVSTAEAVSTVAGRGVGLGALRAACVDLGGRLEIDSRRGAGTTVRCVVPVPPAALARGDA